MQVTKESVRHLQVISRFPIFSLVVQSVMDSSICTTSKIFSIVAVLLDNDKTRVVTPVATGWRPGSFKAHKIWGM